MAEKFNPVDTLEAAGVNDFNIDYHTKVVNIYHEDLGKVEAALGLGRLAEDLLLYRKWLFLGRLPKPIRVQYAACKDVDPQDCFDANYCHGCPAR